MRWWRNEGWRIYGKSDNLCKVFVEPSRLSEVHVFILIQQFNCKKNVFYIYELSFDEKRT